MPEIGNFRKYMFKKYMKKMFNLFKNRKMKLKTVRICILLTWLAKIKNFDNVPFYWGYREKTFML